MPNTQANPNVRNFQPRARTLPNQQQQQTRQAPNQRAPQQAAPNLRNRVDNQLNNAQRGTSRVQRGVRQGTRDLDNTARDATRGARDAARRGQNNVNRQANDIRDRLFNGRGRDLTGQTRDRVDGIRERNPDGRLTPDNDAFGPDRERRGRDGDRVGRDDRDGRDRDRDRFDRGDRDGRDRDGDRVGRDDRDRDGDRFDRDDRRRRDRDGDWWSDGRRGRFGRNDFVWNRHNWYRGNWYHHHHDWDRDWDDDWGWGWGFGSRYGLGWGSLLWGFSPYAYNWGYSPYYNPYWNSGMAFGSYSYAQPVVIATTDQLPADADSQFAAARDAFFNGDYQAALDNVTQAINSSPNDPVLHEFRALTLFALQEYSSGAATINAVLASQPGWDWATLRGLYPSADVYTSQLRQLEAFVTANPEQADARFLLSYHYMTMGHDDAAAAQLRRVVQLMPNDSVATRLLQTLERLPETSAAPPSITDSAPATPAETLPAPNGEPIAAADIVGTWSASHDNGAFTLVLGDDGRFTWNFQPKEGSAREFSGKYTLSEHVLVLDSEEGQTMAASVARTEDGFSFKMIGDAPESEGLAFHR